jgi:hypothetical protein
VIFWPSEAERADSDHVEQQWCACCPDIEGWSVEDGAGRVESLPVEAIALVEPLR